MDAPPVGNGDTCPLFGWSMHWDGCPIRKAPMWQIESHHIVPRSAGGHDGPTVRVCGLGNGAGCHKRLHDHTLHFRHRGGWEWLLTEQPEKYDRALAMDGWQPVARGFE